MVDFDVALSSDQDVINNVLRQVYPVLYTALAMLADAAFTTDVLLISFTLNYIQGSSPTDIPHASLAIDAVVSVETATYPATIQAQGASAKGIYWRPCFGTYTSSSSASEPH
jgi:hypothetical protein